MGRQTMQRASYILAIMLTSVLSVTPLVSAQQLQVKLVNITSPATPGKDATIAVQTSPRAACKITVQYDSGPSKAKGLGPKTADAKGNVKWTWRVGAKTKKGTWPITVSCSQKGHQAKLETALDVR